MTRTRAKGEAKRWPLLELTGAVVWVAWRVVEGVLVVLVERAAVEQVSNSVAQRNKQGQLTGAARRARGGAGAGAGAGALAAARGGARSRGRGASVAHGRRDSDRAAGQDTGADILELGAVVDLAGRIGDPDGVRARGQVREGESVLGTRLASCGSISIGTASSNNKTPCVRGFAYR